MGLRTVTVICWGESSYSYVHGFSPQPALHELDTVEHDYNPSSEEVMGGEAQAQSYLQWHSEFKANLGSETLPSKQKMGYTHWTPLFRTKQRQMANTKMVAVPQQAHYEGGSIKWGDSQWLCLLYFTERAKLCLIGPSCSLPFTYNPS